MVNKSIFGRRIHITFNCEEDVAITDPIITSRPDRIYYFIAYIKRTGQKDVNMNFYRKNISVIKRRLGDVEIITKELDYTNHIEIIQEISKIVKKEREIQENCEIFIQALRGVTGIASYIASNCFDCYLFYEFAKSYDNSGDGARQRGMLFLEFPFVFPFRKPSLECVKVLKLIKEYLNTNPYNQFHENKYIKKNDLVDLLTEKGYLTPKPHPRNERTLISSLYAQLDRRFLNELVSLGYIEILDDHGKKHIVITKIGYQILEIFKYYL